MRRLYAPTFFVLFLFPAVAFAQDAPSTVIDLGPLIEALLALAAAAITAFAGFGVRYLQRKLGIALDEDSRRALMNALNRGVDFALNRAGGLLPREIDARNALVAEAANYVIRSTPDALARFGITPERLREMIEARLPVDEPAIGSTTDVAVDPTPAT